MANTEQFATAREHSGEEPKPPDAPEASDMSQPTVPAASAENRLTTESEDTRDPASEDPGVPAATLRLLPPGRHCLVDRLRAACNEARSSRFLSRHLLTIGLVILVVLLIVILLIQKRQAAEAELSVAAAASDSKARLRVCERPGCVVQAAQTVSYINRSVDPCENFFKYACGRFDEVHPSPSNEALSVSDLMRQHNRDRVLQLIRQEQYYNSSSAISKARLFFSSCLRAYQFSLNNVPSLMQMMRQLGGLDLFASWSPHDWDFNNVLIKASALHLLDAFFETVTWRRDLNEVDLHVPATIDLSLTITTRLYGSRVQKVAKRTRYLMREVLRQLEQDAFATSPTPPRACNDTCVDEIVEDVIAVQEALLAITPKRKFFALKADQTTTQLTMPELRHLVPQIDWRRRLDAMFGVDVVPDLVMFRVPSRSYMSGVGRLIDDTRVKRMQHFLVWPVIRRYLVALGPIYATLGEELDRNLHSQELVETREEQCLALLGRHMAPVLHGLLLAVDIGEENVPRVRDHLLKQALQSFSESFGWMTEESQQRLRGMVENVPTDFGLANLKQSLNALDEYYSTLDFHKLKFFDNLRNLYGFNKPGRILDGFRTSGKPEDVVIAYDWTTSTLKIPFGSLQVPWYNADVPDHLNAAAFGSLVYKALTDAFIITPYAPNMTYLWDSETRHSYNKFARCVANATQNGTPVDATTGLLTLFMPTLNKSVNPPIPRAATIDEYFAYHASYRLYKQLERQEPNTVLPGMQHNTSDQAFYLAFAHARCTNGFPVYYVPAHITGKAPIAIVPPEPKVINEIMLSDPGFREAFQCSGPVPTENAVGLCSPL